MNVSPSTSASLVVALATAAFVWWQARLLRFSLQVQSLLALEKTFNDSEHCRSRHLAARQLLNNAPDEEVEDVLDFFDTLGLLVRRGALDAEMVWHTFFYWIFGYWHAAQEDIERERRKNSLVWEDLATLYQRILAIENERGVQRQEDIRDFLEAEAQQSEGEAGTSA